MTEVVFVHHTSDVSGAERVLLDLVAHGHRCGDVVTVVCPRGPLTELLPGAVRHVAIPSLGLGGAQGLRRGVAAAEYAMRSARAARVIGRTHGDRHIANSLLALPALRSSGRTFGYLGHDVAHRRSQRAILRLSRRALSGAVAVSAETASPLRPLGIDCRVAVNGTTWPVPARTVELGRPPVVGMLALLTPWKGHHVLLDAVADIPGVHVEFAGRALPADRGYTDDLRRRARRPDLRDRVHFLGHVPAATALARWDVAVSASIAPEAGPLAVLEAMAHGVPTVATDHGGSRSYLGGTGLLVPPNDPAALASALDRALGDMPLRRVLSAASRERIAEVHDSTRTIPALYNALVHDTASDE
ncbi:glycosyltransferase [Rhodococcus rhodnii]|uniref:Glycosyl transferase family 1 domain-containing protein n=2 Tax=Rhodococcus rhodnii TaxID=38312 RepID=R7WS19_9NOCA|nr:glycosyltransferase family 4 protein [Rhodococcus rhodnii]EOM78106.1 hypothetical protein Rrhod_0531 [Rhodococcus rhodnii LMG 5362]TXG90107.1 glycosyltransferase [Rhodococcus rhodnii]